MKRNQNGLQKRNKKIRKLKKGSVIPLELTNPYFQFCKRNLKQKKPPLGRLYFISRKAFANNFRIYPKKNWNYYLTNKYESLDINDFEDLNICKILMKENVGKI